MTREKSVQLCPVCKKTGLDLYLGGYLGKMYFCRSCGYVGALVIEMSLEDYLEMLKGQ
ncbi:MAG: hypothetical protein QXE96_02280 [Candidatus Caldarchaeum sp.]